MKRLIVIIFVLFKCTASLAQMIPVSDFKSVEPRMRVNRTAATVLSTTFQTIPFNGTSTINFNTYPVESISGKQYVWYDTATNLFKVMGDFDRNLNVQFFFRTTTTALAIGTSMQYRIVIPNGVSPGVDFYFPFPDDGGYGEIMSLGLVTTATNAITVPLSIYANTSLRTNGFYLQARLSQAITLGTSTINSAACVITSRY